MLSASPPPPPFFLFFYLFIFSWCFTSTEIIRFIGTGEGEVKVSNLVFYAKLTTAVVGEEGDHIYLSLYTDQNDSYIGSNNSHFNVSLTVKDTVTRVCKNKKNEEGRRDYKCLSLHCHHQHDTCIKMGSDDSHFNVFLLVRDKVTRQCLKNNYF